MRKSRVTDTMAQLIVVGVGILMLSGLAWAITSIWRAML